MRIFNKKEAKWYFYFGLGAMFVAAGALWMFYHFAQVPHLAVKGIEPDFPITAIFLFVFGTLTFLITKYFYEKQKVIK